MTLGDTITAAMQDGYSHITTLAGPQRLLGWRAEEHADEGYEYDAGERKITGRWQIIGSQAFRPLFPVSE